jgi:hypothetical protein
MFERRRKWALSLLAAWPTARSLACLLDLHALVRSFAASAFICFLLSSLNRNRENIDFKNVCLWDLRRLGCRRSLPHVRSLEMYIKHWCHILPLCRPKSGDSLHPLQVHYLHIWSQNVELFECQMLNMVKLGKFYLSSTYKKFDFWKFDIRDFFLKNQTFL